MRNSRAKTQNVNYEPIKISPTLYFTTKYKLRLKKIYNFIIERKTVKRIRNYTKIYLDKILWKKTCQIKNALLLYIYQCVCIISQLFDSR